MMKLTGGMLVVLCGWGIGMVMSLGLSARVRALEGTIAYLTAMGQELRYTMAPLDQLVARLGARREFEGLELAHICRESDEKGINFTDLINGSLERLEQDLGVEGCQALTSLAEVMGAIDLQGQLAALELCISGLVQQLAGARRRKESHTKLYTNVGLLSGAALAILIW